MSEGHDAHAAALAHARAALLDGRAGEASVRATGTLLSPLPIVDPAGAAAGWLVPVAAGERLLGFVQLDARLRFHRYSSFQRRSGQVEDCPLVADWTDPAVVAKRALTTVAGGALVGPPVLSYDRHPDRVAWRVVVRGRDGRQHRLHVTGSLVSPVLEEGAGAS